MNKPADMKATETVPLWVNGRKQAATVDEQEQPGGYRWERWR